MNRRDFFRFAGQTAFLGAALTGVWGFVLQPFMPRLYHIQIKLPGLGGKIRIVQLSDFHAGPHTANAVIERAVQMAGEQNADLIALTGDYVSFKSKYIGIVTRELKKLHPSLGIWGCFGNHDYWAVIEPIRESMGEIGVNLLENRGEVIIKDSAKFYLCGVGDIWEGEDDLPRAVAGRPAGMSAVMLCHNPDFAFQAAREKIDLMLSGHTHGGQVKLPFIGAPVIPSVYGKRFTAGLCDAEGMKVYVNRGIGNINPPLRLGVPPEVTVIELIDSTIKELA